MRVIQGAAVVATAIAAVLAARPASACGGCFHVPTPEQTTVVTGHRMAFSISPQQSVLWDQIEYSGSPSNFAWVLPVRAGAQIQLSHDQLFAALDAMTNPVITGPTPNCGSGGSGFGCSSSSASGNASGFSAASGSGGGGGGGGNGVQVLSQGVVGPYEQVTLKSTNPNALYDWLVANSYDIPSSIRPIVDAYVSAGFDFIALKLAPGQGVQAMQPVRIVTPGAGLTLPLRMVAAGVGANVGITLYVMGDGRYQAQSFPNGVVQDSQLVWLHAQAQSNYETVAEQIMQGAGGRTWLTEFSQPVFLPGSPSQTSADGYQCGPSVGGGAGGGASTFNTQSLPDLYYAQCLCLTACPELPDASDDAASVSSPDGGCDTCAGFDDLSVAVTGLDPSSTWLTRMRAILPASALTAGDLVLQAASPQVTVSNQYTVKTYDDPTYNPCQTASGNGANGGGGGCTAAEEPPVMSGRTLVVLSLALLAASFVRRRVRSR